MRLILAAHAFPRAPGDMAGSFLGRLAERLVARGHTVAIVVPADRGRDAPRTFAGADVLSVRYAAPARETLAYTGDMQRGARSPVGAWTFLRLVRAMRQTIRRAVARYRADLVHAFWWVPGGWAATGASVPVVVSLMGTDVALLRSWPARWLARRVLRRAARVTALSTFLTDEVRRRLALPEVPITRVPMPVDPERFVTPQGGEAARGGGIAYLGRLSDQKRVDLLLDAVHAAGLTAPVRIVGDGPARAALEAQAARLGLQQVRFLGTRPDTELPALLRDADVAAFPSRGEGLGLAAVEMLMLGVPVVATTDGGGVLDLVQDGAGAAVVEPTPAAFAAGLARCLGDPGARAAARDAGARLRATLSPDAIARQFEDIYAELARA